MTNSYALMTALPPTRGHLELIQYASRLGERAHIVVATQPGEPFWMERVMALTDAARSMPNVHIHHLHRKLPQEPTPESEAEFFTMWAGFLRDFGAQPGDYIVASEKYGIPVAEFVGGIFMPYDMQRVITNTKATNIRAATLDLFPDIMPEFQPYLRKRITIFGAESCGKTSVAQALGTGTHYRRYTSWFPEWARPYLETVGPEINMQSMTAIWHGQRALQDVAEQVAAYHNKPFIVQDTDLYSTVGYWLLKGHEFDPSGGHDSVPAALLVDAATRKSDLYIILDTNIPFEEDQLRYGGDVRESDTGFWVSLCKRHNLNYKVIDAPKLSDRIHLSMEYMRELFGEPLKYQREGKEYGSDKVHSDN